MVAIENRVQGVHNGLPAGLPIDCYCRIHSRRICHNSTVFILAIHSPLLFHELDDEWQLLLRNAIRLILAVDISFIQLLITLENIHKRGITTRYFVNKFSLILRPYSIVCGENAKAVIEKAIPFMIEAELPAKTSGNRSPVNRYSIDYRQIF